MTENRGLPIMIGMLVAIGLFQTGCATFQRSQTVQTEGLLAAAGFQMRLADTTKKRSALEAMPQRKLVPQKQNGKLRFSYADARGCECLYVGTQAAYQRYQQLAFQQSISEQELTAAGLYEDSALDWSLWGPWYDPWY